MTPSTGYLYCTGGTETELEAYTLGTGDHGHCALLRERIQGQNIRGQQK